MKFIFRKRYFSLKNRIGDIAFFSFTMIYWIFFLFLLNIEDIPFELLAMWFILFFLALIIITGIDYSIMISSEPKKETEEKEKRKVPINLIFIIDLLIFVFSQLLLNFISITFLFFVVTVIFNEQSSLIVFLFFVSIYLVFFLIKTMYWLSKEIVLGILLEKGQDLSAIRKILYLISFILLFGLIYLTALNPVSEYSISFKENNLILVIFLISIVGMLIINILTTIFAYYTAVNLLRFEEVYKCETGFLSLVGLKKIKGKRFFPILLLMSMFLIIILIIGIQFILEKPTSEEIILTMMKGFFRAFGVISLFISFILLCWVILRVEDIVVTKSALRFTDDFKLMTDNEKLEKKISKYKNTIKDKHDSNEKITLWKVIIVKKIEFLIDGLDGLLIGSLPIMFLGISFYLIGKIFIGSDISVGGNFEPNVDITDLMGGFFLISSLYSLVLMLVYQGGRQFIIREIKNSLKNMSFRDKYYLLLKDFNLYISKPDIVVSSIIILFPVISFIIRYLPDLIKITGMN